jgi:hypothetical protein
MLVLCKKKTNTIFLLEIYLLNYARELRLLLCVCVCVCVFNTIPHNSKFKVLNLNIFFAIWGIIGFIFSLQS